MLDISLPATGSYPQTAKCLLHVHPLQFSYSPELALKSSKVSKEKELLRLIHPVIVSPLQVCVLLATLNVRTLRTEESEVELAYALEEIKFDILGLSEVRRIGEAIVEKENGGLMVPQRGHPRSKRS